MFSLPDRPKKKEPKCEIRIGEVRFIESPSKQIEVNDVENFGNADCVMKGSVSVKPSTNQSWTTVQVIWNPPSLPPGGISKITFNYEWTSGATYFIKVITEKTLETMAYGKAP